MKKKLVSLVVAATFCFPVTVTMAAEVQPVHESYSSTQRGRVSEHLFGLNGLSNVGRVAPGVYRGAQPEPEGYKTLKKMGIKTVVNLRNLHGEKKAVEEAGMTSIEVPINIWSSPDPEKFRKVVAILADPASQPVFVHCAHGQDRTGAVVAIYRMQIDGWPLADAEAEMQSFGFNDVWDHLKKFVRSVPVANSASVRKRDP